MQGQLLLVYSNVRRLHKLLLNINLIAIKVQITGLRSTATYLELEARISAAQKMPKIIESVYEKTSSVEIVTHIQICICTNELIHITMQIGRKLDIESIYCLHDQLGALIQAYTGLVIAAHFYWYSHCDDG